MTSSCRNSFPIPILTYHQIAEAPERGAPFRSLYVSPRDFARQMSFLALLGYRGLSMGQLLPYLRGECSGRVFGITFDDGYVNNLTHALPVLQNLNFSSTCYAVSQLLAKTNVWDQEIGIAQVPLMSVEQLRLWIAGGQEVGAHTRHHVRLTELDPATGDSEIAGSKQELEQLTGCAVDHFCYPYGDYSEAVRLAVEKAGFASASTTHRGRCQSGDGLYALPRVPVLRSTTRLLLWMKMVSRYEDRRRQ